jgi:hypothetical protein
MAVYLENVLSLEKFRWSGSEIRVQHDASVARTPFNRRQIEATRQGAVIG